MRMAGEWVLLLLMTPWMALASMRIVSPSESPFINQSIPCVVFNTMIGPQMDYLLAAPPIVGEMIILRTDPCLLDNVPDSVRGRIIVFTDISCLPSSIYMKMSVKQVVAIVICLDETVPGVDVYTNYNGDDDITRLGTLPAFQISCLTMSISGTTISFSDYIKSWETDNPTNVLIQLTPDTNQWFATFNGALYQMTVRVFPTLTFLIAGLSSALYSVILLMMDRALFWEETPVGLTSSWVRFFRYMCRQLRLHHLLLCIETLSCLILAIVVSVGGWYSTPNLRKNFVYFFTTGNSGYQLACDVISARIWHEMNVDIANSSSEKLISRIMQHPIGGTMMITIPVILDTLIGLMFAGVIPNLEAINVLAVLVLLTLQLIIGIHFIHEAYRFKKAVQRIGKVTKTLARTKGAFIRDAFIERFCVLTGRLGICCVINVIVLPFGATQLIYTPTGWALFWAIALNMRALSSLCRVIMFRPRPFLPIVDFISDLIAAKGAPPIKQGKRTKITGAKIAPIPH